ncbi:MAG: prolyl oligopeptidase family protein [Bacteroidota bacterium]
MKYSGTHSMILLIFGLLFGTLAGNSQNFHYPQPKKVDVIDDYHGVKVADPYRWMEDLESPDLKTWIDAENTITHEYIDANPDRAKIKNRLTELWNYPRYSVPFKAGNRYFYSLNNGLQNQAVLFMQDAGKSDSTVILDPNTLSTDGTVALSNQSYSEDGTLLAYGLSMSGSDREEIHIKNLNTGKDYDEKLLWTKFAGIGWKIDNSGFYYNRFPEPGTVAKEDENNYNRVYWHTLNTPQSQDKLIYEQPDAKELSFSPSVTDDGKFLILSVWHGTDSQNRVYYRRVDSDGPFIRLLPDADAKYNFIDNEGSTFYFDTDLNAPKERIIAIDLNHPARDQWKEIIPEGSDVISSVALVNHMFVVSYLHDAYSQLKLYDEKGSFINELTLPTIGSVGGLSGKKDDNELFFSFTSFLYPPAIFRYDCSAGGLAPFHEVKSGFDQTMYETKQVFYPSKDGTKIPMFLTYKKGLQLNGNNPVLLYGYGGFDVSMTPNFSASRVVFLENGGIYALACLRGGSEYGEEWHKAGMLDKKQNVFNDFIYTAKYLIAEKYTSTPKLSILGGSNGGLLTAACELQQPQLFGAVVCQVPVTDMLRYHKFTVGRYWTGEYGNAEENPDQFKFMYAYSPLHNVKKGVAYPPTLITTADHDDRVVPSHAMKFTATMQENDAGTNPILIRIDTKAGHGGGKPTAKLIEEYSDIYAFLFKALGMRVSD